MGIDVHLYKWENIDYPECHYVHVPEVQLRESYFRNEFYATKVLFREAFDSKYTQIIQPRSEELQSRLPEALETIEKRYRNMPASEKPEDLKQYEAEEKALVTKFVEVYSKEQDEGNDPFVQVSY